MRPMGQNSPFEFFGSANEVRLGLARALVTLVLVLIVWQAVIAIFELPRFILPSPLEVSFTLWQQAPSLLHHAGITLLEIVLGLLAGTVLGVGTALLINLIPAARRHIMPVVVASQALPVFAIAPMLILWFGLGLGSKIAMATLIIYFPICSALNDGLMRAQGDLIDLAKVNGATPLQTLLHFRLPAAMPSLASGLRVAASIAPIGAIVGEWVGAAAGLGYVINQANARMQTDTVFAALIVLIAMVILLRWIVDTALDRLVHWTPSTGNPAI